MRGSMARLPMAMGLGALLLAPTAAGAQSLEERGQVLFTEQRCNLCHSVGGEGNEDGPLDDVGSRLTAEELEAWLVDPRGMTEKTGSTRRPAMRPYPSLSEADRAALVAYLLALTE